MAAAAEKCPMPICIFCNADVACVSCKEPVPVDEQTCHSCGHCETEVIGFHESHLCDHNDMKLVFVSPPLAPQPRAKQIESPLDEDRN
jgi:hypothetical protein